MVSRGSRRPDFSTIDNPLQEIEGRNRPAALQVVHGMPYPGLDPGDSLIFLIVFVFLRRAPTGKRHYFVLWRPSLGDRLRYRSRGFGRFRRSRPLFPCPLRPAGGFHQLVLDADDPRAGVPRKGAGKDQKLPFGPRFKGNLAMIRLVPLRRLKQGHYFFGFDGLLKSGVLRGLHEEQIVKGYQYEKGKFVVLKEEDFARVDVEATQTVDIFNFVKIEDVDPLLFYKPYYLEVGKGGDKAYVLLRDALVKSGKIAIAKVVIRARQHLAAVKPQKEGLVLELMHFPDELVDVEEFKEPVEKSIGKPEMQMAERLIDSMTTAWKPDQYKDEYHDALEKLIEEKIEHGDEKSGPAPKKKVKPTNVVDLVSILQQSIKDSQGGKSSKPKKKTAAKPRARHKKAA